ncbi:hypothetical protein F4804DRAFT_324966 [Jackrogersella minutella]|nr:hypothetical protein F4804DRAFT_324966 [Jackrogersella minutella]
MLGISSTTLRRTFVLLALSISLSYICRSRCLSALTPCQQSPRVISHALGVYIKKENIPCSSIQIAHSTPQVNTAYHLTGRYCTHV